MRVTNAVGVIGLGAMGRGMATSLRRAGYTVHVCDARPGAAAEFAVDGGVACATPAEVAAACPVVISVVVAWPLLAATALVAAWRWWSAVAGRNPSA